MTAYYNEFDPYAAQWLRNLIEAGQIAPGIVDERSIEDVHPSDLRGFTQCHFFAGIGVWSHALRSAGWPDDREIWTGSCPCQPFSAAGKGKGINDERHLWPAFARLIAACRPDVVMGEQVASSLVSGKRTSPHLQRLWERKARLGVLADWLEEDLSLHLQGMQKQNGSGIASDAQEFDCYQGIEINRGSEIKGGIEGFAIRLDGAMGSGGSGLWSLRGHWDRFRSELEPGMEHAVAGSDRGWGWVHDGQHQSGAVWAQRGMRDMGREQGDRDGQRDYEAAAEAIRRAAAEADREINAEDGDSWIDTLQLDVEALGYAFGAVPFPSASVGAPHIRDRLYWVADSAGAGSQGGRPVRGARPGREGGATERGGQAGGLAHADSSPCGERCSLIRGRPDRGDAQSRAGLGRSGMSVGLANVHSDGCHEAGQCVTQAGCDGSAGDCAACGVVNTQSSGWARQSIRAAAGGSQVRAEERGDPLRAGPVNGFWSDADWLFCRDGKWRPVEPGTFPLVAGAAGGMGRVRAGWHAPAGKEGFGHRAGRLKGYGNAINAEAARVFIECVMEARAAC